MNTVLKIFLSMSFSGGVLILVLLLGKRFLKDKISRQWQYYIWLIVILRLLLPFGSEINLLGKIYQTVDQSFSRTAPLDQQPAQNTPDVLVPSAGFEQNHTLVPSAGLKQNNTLVPSADFEQNNKKAHSLAENLTPARPFQEIGTLLTEHIWLIWLVTALGLLIRKVTIYQGFKWYMKAGLTSVSDLAILDRLSIAAERAGIQKPVELCVNPLVSSPLLIGFFHPCIVLPSTDISEKDFWYIVLHELTHYKRLDMFYKWLVQITVCMHWFNPLVYLMSREITKACEFSCDEAVLTKMGSDNAQDYGKTLLDAMAAVGKYKQNLGSVTLSENKQLLKERLGAIMNFKKRSMGMRVFTGVLTLCIIWGAAFIGIYSTAAASNQASNQPSDKPLPSKNQASNPKNSAQLQTASHRGDDASENQASENQNSARLQTAAYHGDDAFQAVQYYKAGNLPLFQRAFFRMDEKAQSEWLDRIYMDNQISFFGAIVNMLEEDCALIQHLAERIYKDNNPVFFSILAAHMSEDTLEAWLERALEEENWTFQSILFHTLGWDDEFDKQEDEWEKEWEAAQTAEYQAVGITIEGKDYYYQGQLVNIFLDIRKEASFYVLNMNPKGTINIKIIRNENHEITGVTYMTEEEVTKLFGDMDDPDDR